MNFNISEIQLYKLLFYIGFGILLLFVFFIINNFFIPLLKNKRHTINRYWQKIQIIAWIIFSGMFFIALFRVNLIITLTFTVIILGLGWSYWRNIFLGIVIKFSNQLEPGEVISTDFVKGELKSINLSQAELINDKGEMVIIPNEKLRGAVLTHYHKKSSVQTHSFNISFSAIKTIGNIHQMAINCPYISANQKVEVQRTSDNNFVVNASIIDSSFVDMVTQYFLSKKEG